MNYNSAVCFLNTCGRGQEPCTRPWTTKAFLLLGLQDGLQG